jgi:DNA adenine methylase
MDRPVLRWFGGKYNLAPWIISFFPDHRVYVEPFGGAASVLMQKRPARIEFYNDLDTNAVNVFRVLRDPELCRQLEAAIKFTPYSREEHVAALAPTEEPVERARRFMVRSFMGIGSDAYSLTVATGFRADISERFSNPFNQWKDFPAQLSAFCERLKGVYVENMDAFKLIAKTDAEDTLFYLDPPYVGETRSSGDYAFELKEHTGFIETILKLKGMVVLSGYAHPSYDALGWERHDYKTKDGRNQAKTESVWLNAAAAGSQRQSSLFGGI